MLLWGERLCLSLVFTSWLRSMCLTLGGDDDLEAEGRRVSSPGEKGECSYLLRTWTAQGLTGAMLMVRMGKAVLLCG